MTTAQTILAILARHADLDDLDLMQLGIDSAGMINVIIAIEDAFDLDVEDDEYIHQLRSVGDIVRAVERMREAA